MKVLFFASYYTEYLSDFYKKNPGLEKESYESQLNAIMKDYFGVFTSYVEHFKQLGIDASLIIPNALPLQKAWATENNVEFNKKNWEFTIPIRQIEKVKPDIFYLASMFEYYGPFLEEVKKHARNVFGWISCDIPAGINLKQIQVLFSAVPYFIDDFRKADLKAEYINAAFNPNILKLLPTHSTPDIDFSFIGSLTRAHQNRIKLIKQLLDKTEMKFFGVGLKNIPDDRSVLLRAFTKSKYHEKSNGQVWGLDMFKTLQRSKITFNNHIDVSKNYIGNMRMYEATGVGTLLLTDGKYAHEKNFNEDEVIYYESAEDAIEKVNYYLNNEYERSLIAAKGQQRTLRDYNYAKSTSLMLEHFKKHMN